MPTIHPSPYQVRGLLKNGHLHTVIAALFRKVSDITYSRERIETPDGDFIDLDWSRLGSSKLVVVLHGLEASANIPYVKGMVQYFNQRGWDGIGMNFRGCSGVPNRTLRAYHSGETEDLAWVLQHIIEKNTYDSIALVGFSLGGNVLLKFMGEQRELLRQVSSAVAISVPCDLSGVSEKLNHWQNRIYLKRFMYYLNKKLNTKLHQFPEQISLPLNRMPKTFFEYDHYFTGPVHGFSGAKDYWEKSSSLTFIPRISIPTLLLSALDDPFLTKKCFPRHLSSKNEQFYLETPFHGGHVGFILPGSQYSYTEQRAFDFINQHTHE